MKATGVVRRIDDLGRIVIPKEIRKTLRIKEGTPLEIFTEKEGNIVLKKYSPIGELSNFSSEYAECISNVTNYICVITDKDCVIAVSGMPKRNLLEEPISEDLEKIIDKRDILITTEKKDINITRKSYPDVLKNLSGAKIVVPIVSESEVIGCIILVKKSSFDVQKSEQEIAKVAASFLGSHLEI